LQTNETAMMNNKIIITGIIALLSLLNANAQQKDTVGMLKEVMVTGYITVHGVGHLLEVKTALYTQARKLK
jgi:hypothetical protein